MGERISLLYPKQDVSELVRAMPGIFKGDSYTAIWHGTHQSGQPLWLDISFSPYTFGGKIAGMIGIAKDVTEQHAAELRLMSSRKRFDTILDTMSVMLWESDTSKNCIYFNRAWLQFTGKTFEEEYGYGWAEGVHPDDFDRCVAIYTEAFDKRLPFQMDYRLKRHDGEYRWILDEGVPEYDAQGNFYGYVGSCFDITERVNQAEAVRKSEERLRAILETIPFPIAILAENGRLLYHNHHTQPLLPFLASAEPHQSPQACELCGAESGTQQQTNLAIQIGQLTEKLNRDGQIDNLEISVLPKEGQQRWLLAYARLIQFDGRQASFICFNDITDRKQTENSLRESEERYRLVAENITDVLWTIDETRTNFTFVTPSVTNLYGYTPEEFLHTKSWDLLMPEEREKVLQAAHERNLQEYIKPQTPHTNRVELLQRRKDGSPVWTEVITNRLTGANGESEGFVGVTRDISQRKQFEQQLEVQNQELRRINQELDNFVYRVSHDLRAPLCSAMGLTELMQALDSAEDIKSYLTFQRKTFEKLDNFIREILDYSRNSRVEVSRDQIDVAALLEELLAPAYVQASQQEVRLEVEISISHIIADALRLSIILNNLVSNALKFVRPFAEPWVRISVHQVGQSVAISISDNGTGIHPDRTDRLFQMFYRATDEHYGSGLGLYIARQAAQAMGGELTVNTVWNQGSTFTLLLPQPPEQQPVFSTETHVSTLQASVPISGE